MTSLDPIHKALTKRRGALGTAVADVICGLITEGAMLGELREVVLCGRDGAPTLGDDGKPRACRTMPPEWLERLARAIEVGAFDRLTTKEIIARIPAAAVAAAARCRGQFCCVPRSLKSPTF